MPVGKSTLSRWVYEFSCKDCKNVQYVNDPAHHREGMYCIPAIRAMDAGEDWKGCHADDDRHLRCDCYDPKERKV